MRTIDADAFVLELRAWARTSKEKAEQSIGIRKWQYKAIQWTLQALIKQLNNGTIPVIEAEPVRHGRWVPVPSSDTVMGRAYTCSECEKMRFGSFKPNYCPNCGAKMDKEDK